MKCERVKAKVHWYVAGALSSRQARAIEQHVSQCPDCAKALAEAKAIPQLLKNLPVPQPHPDLAARIDAAVRAHAASRPVAARHLKPALVAAAALAVAIIAVLVVPLVHRPLSLNASSPATSRFAATPPATTDTPARPSPGARTRPPVPADSSRLVRRAAPGAESRARRLMSAGAGMRFAAAKPQNVPAPGAPTAAARPAHQDTLAPAELGCSTASQDLRTVATIAAAPEHLVMASQRISQLPTTVQPATRPRQAAGLTISGEIASGLIAATLLNEYIEKNVIETTDTALAIATSVPTVPTLSISDTAVKVGE